MKDPIIGVKGLSVRYGESVILGGVDFTCQSGEFVTVVGRSGTGKSSFLNALAGLIAYDGRVFLGDVYGYVFQSYALFPWMTVAGNIRFGLVRGPRELQDRRVEEMLARIEMTEFADRYPSELSGGQVQRVALARALAPDPAILLMDEPYAALDYLTRERMQEWLLAIWQETRKTVLFVTHNLEEAIFLSDRVIVLRDGLFVTDIEVPFGRPRKDDLRYTEHFLNIKHALIDHMVG